MKKPGIIARYAITGVTVAALYVLLYMGFQALGMARMPANAMAFGIAVAAQYLGQARFTYNRPIADPLQITRFGSMIGAGFVTSALITSFIAPKLGLADSVSAVAVALVLPVQNFIFMTLWVFSSQHPRKGRPS